MGIEARAVEHPTHVALGDLDLRIVGREEDDPGDLAGGPLRPVRVRELPQPRVAHTFGAAHGRPHGAVALEQCHIQLGRRLFRLPRGNGPGGSGAHDQDVDVRHWPPWPGPQRGRG